MTFGVWVDHRQSDRGPADVSEKTGPSAARGCVVAPNARPSVRSVVCSPPQSATTHPTGGTVRPIPSVSEAQRLVNCRHPHGRSEPSAATKSPTRRRWRALVASGRGGERLVPARVGRGEVAMGGMNRGAPASCGAGTRVALVVLCPLARVRGGENRDQHFGLFRVRRREAAGFKPKRAL